MFVFGPNIQRYSDDFFANLLQRRRQANYSAEQNKERESYTVRNASPKFSAHAEVNASEFQENLEEYFQGKLDKKINCCKSSSIFLNTHTHIYISVYICHAHIYIYICVIYVYTHIYTCVCTIFF